jgi:hypothetical protein
MIGANALQCSDIRFGSKADIRAVHRHVCFTPESGHVDHVGNVRFGPIPDQVHRSK